MTINTEILKYAAKNKQFARKDLVAHFREQMHAVFPLTVAQQLNRLVQKGGLTRIERGVYQLQGTKTLFVPQITDEFRELNVQLKARFPFTDFCVWHNSEILPFMHHLPNLRQIFVEVEHDAVHSVFDFLNENGKKRVFLLPDSDDYSRSREWLQQVVQENNFPNIPLIEKAVRAFSLLESLVRSGCILLSGNLCHERRNRLCFA